MGKRTKRLFFFYIIKGAVFYLTIRRIWIEMLGMIENL